MSRITKLVILAALLGLILAPAAMAQLAPHGSLGPVDLTTNANGFPLWVEDINGVKLDLPNPPYGDGVNAPTLIYDPVIPNNDLSAAAGFGAEAFFYLAESVVDLATGGRALLVLGIEAAYGAGEPDPLAPPDQFLFARVRVRFDATVAGTYTVKHPWGEEKLVVADADVGNRFSYTNDWGGFAPIPNPNPDISTPLVASSFERILYSPKQWVFLKADPANINLATGAPPVQKTYMVGDGVTPGALLSATFGPEGPAVYTKFTINGPADPAIPGDLGPLVADSDQFTVSGHIYSAAGTNIVTPGGTGGGGTGGDPLATDTVNIDRARLRGAQVEVRATSSNGFPMTALLYSGTTLVGSGNLGTNGRGNISFSGPAPNEVRVHSNSNNSTILGGTDTAPVN